jgi:hypothetical protein
MVPAKILLFYYCVRFKLFLIESHIYLREKLKYGFKKSDYF